MSSVASIALGSAVQAADVVALKKPAVSAINARIEGAFGSNDGDGFGHVAGAITLPIGERFGFQVDGLIRFGNDQTDIGGAAHLFWRDPDKGLVGLYASYMQFNRDNPDIFVAKAFGVDSSVARVGLEAEAYFGDFSIIGVAGWQQSDIGEGKGTSKETNPFADIDFAYYATDDLRLTAGYRYDGFDSFGVVGAEYKFASSASAKIEGQFGEDTSRVWAGLTFHIGGNDPNKSLKGRQREDDPTIWMTRQFAPVLKIKDGGGGGAGCALATRRSSPLIAVCPPGVTPPTSFSDCGVISDTGCYACYSPQPELGSTVCFSFPDPES